jgi:hypothetical protein
MLHQRFQAFVLSWNFCTRSNINAKDACVLVLICVFQVVCVTHGWSFTLFCRSNSLLTFHSSSAITTKKVKLRFYHIFEVLWQFNPVRVTQKSEQVPGDFAGFVAALMMVIPLAKFCWCNLWEVGLYDLTLTHHELWSFLPSKEGTQDCKYDVDEYCRAVDVKAMLWSSQFQQKNQIFRGSS